MQLIDKDLISIQETRILLAKAKKAQVELAKMSQSEIDKICEAMKDAALQNTERLAKMAVEETGFGRFEDKIIKNYFAAQVVYDSIKDLKTVGVINEDKEKKLVEIAVPVGIIAGLIPSTNPTSTTIYKLLISIKAGNAIIIAPHPSAINCITETVRALKAVAMAAGMPEDCITCISQVSLQGTDTLLKHKDTSLILATGGNAMVKAAYSSGTPALGVGPGNGPAFIEKSADFEHAVKQIVESKTFDNGLICASEQSIIVERESENAVVKELEKQKCYFLTNDEKERLEKIMLTPNLTMNPKIVGKTAQYVADLAGIDIPSDAKIMIGREYKVGPKHPFSREKLCPILAFFVEDDWHKACEKAIKLLENEGAGHTMIIHSKNEEIIREFGLKKPVSRFLVNTPGTLGGIGATTNLFPSLTLGCGAVGGSATSDNISAMHLMDTRVIAYGVTELDDIKSTISKELKNCPQKNTTDKPNNQKSEKNNLDLVTELVLEKLKEQLNI